MNKIVCDICGTSYPSTSACCPICGCSSDAAAEFLKTDLSQEELSEEAVSAEAAAPRKKGIFNYDEVNSAPVPRTAEPEDDDGDDDDEMDDEDDEEEEAPRHNVFAVIGLTVLIVALLAAAAFIFFRYFLPNMGQEEPVSTNAVVQEAETTAAATEPMVPCEHMAMTNAGVAELSAEGQQFLLHIKALPENTTEKIIYTSGDESVATVTEDGKITAVSEGETIIYISCGTQRIECPVIVKYVEETVPPTTAATEATEATEAVEATGEATEAPAETADPGLKDVKLKLKKTDIQLGIYYEFQLVLDCDLTPEEVTWSSEHPHIATVDAQGNVKAVKEGTTSITAKYGDQEVSCIVRCIWY